MKRSRGDRTDGAARETPSMRCSPARPARDHFRGRMRCSPARPARDHFRGRFPEHSADRVSRRVLSVRRRDRGRDDDPRDRGGPASRPPRRARDARAHDARSPPADHRRDGTAMPLCCQRRSRWRAWSFSRVGPVVAAGSHASPFDHRRALLNFLNCGKLEATSLESAAVVRVRQRHEWRHVGLKWLKLLATTKL